MGWDNRTVLTHGLNVDGASLYMMTAQQVDGVVALFKLLSSLVSIPISKDCNFATSLQLARR